MATLMTPGDTAKAIIRNLPEKTGKMLDEWVSLVKRAGLSSDRDAAKWLKTEHGLGHFQAQIVAEEAFGKSMVMAYQDSESLVRALYSGKKERLRPLHEKIVAAGCKLGQDVQVSACRTYVSLYRNRQFVVLRARVSGLEIGLALTPPQQDARLQTVKRGATDRVTCRILISDPSEIDQQILDWLKDAYAQAG